MKSNFLEKVLREMDGAGTDRRDYIRVLVLWSVFESELKMQSGKSSAAAALNAVKKLGDTLPLIESKKAFWSTIENYRRSVVQLSYQKSIKGRLVTCAYQSGDEEDVGKVLEAIYAIRNMVAHGDIQIEWGGGQSRESALLHAAAVILWKWLRFGEIEIQ